MGDRSSIWDKLTVATVVAAAAIEALQQALKDAPNVKAAYPVLDLSGAWNYVPLGLLSIGALIWLARMAFRLGYDTQSKSLNELLHLEPAKGQPAPAAAPILPATVSVAAKSAGRTYAPESFSLAYVEFRCGKHTPLQADAMLRPHVGQWLRLAGVMKDNSMMGGEVFVHIGVGANGRDGSVIVYFDAAWKGHLSRLKLGDQMALEAEIVDDDRPEISLRHAELL
jgi:hypothetical protein